MPNNIKVLAIYNPANDGDDAAVSDPMGMGAGPLHQASGNATGSQIAEVRAICEKIPGQNTPPNMNYAGEAKTNGKTVAGYGGGSWSATMIPGAQCHPTDATKQWNYLHIWTYYYGMPVKEATPEFRRFKGIAGSFALLTEPQAARREAALPGLAQAGFAFSKVVDLIDAWWARDIGTISQVTREPAERDGDWLLYRGLPVDSPLGTVLSLDSKPLRASSVALAAPAVRVCRKPPFPPPNVDVGGPLGTGQTAVHAGPTIWRFAGFPRFGLILHQHAGPDAETLIFSVAREAPTVAFTNPKLPLVISINSPVAEDWMNHGCVDLWVRVLSR